MIATAANDARNRWSVRCLAALITAYQRYVSPYKGFCCAHRVAHGGLSCSAYAKRQLLRRGIGEAARRMRMRFAACAAAAVLLHAAAAGANGDEARRRARKATRPISRTAAHTCRIPSRRCSCTAPTAHARRPRARTSGAARARRRACRSEPSGVESA